MAASMFIRSRTHIKTIHKCSEVVMFGQRHAYSTEGVATNKVSTRRQERNIAKASAVPEIPYEKYPPGQWGDMDPDVAWAWAKDGAQILRYEQYTGIQKKIKLITKKVFKTWKFPAINLAPRCLEYQCGITKSYTQHWLPEKYETVPDLEMDEYERVKAAVIDYLELENQMNRSRARKMFDQKRSGMNNYTETMWPYEQSRIKFEALLTNILSTLNGHDSLKDVSIDKDVTVAACFHRYGVKRGKVLPAAKSTVLKKLREQNNSPFQGEHVIDFQIRKKNRLPQFVDLDDTLCVGEYPTMYNQYNPKYLGQFQEHMQRKITAGFTWQRPFNPHVFTHLSVGFLNNNRLAYMENLYGEETRDETTVGYALNAGFLSTLAQAYTQGFNEYQEISCPFTSQTILTDGRQFKFSCYQLNTMLLYKPDDVNPFRNLFWVADTESLYDSFDESGRIVGFDEDVLRTLLKFLLIPPGEAGRFKADGLTLRPVTKKKAKIAKEVVYDTGA